MAIEDYFYDIDVLSVLDKTPDMVGGLSGEYQKIDTIRGLINQKSGQQSTIGGKSNEETWCNGYFEITDDSTNYLIAENRLLDDGKVYRIVPKKKNTVNRNNHYKVDLVYMNHIEESS
jgi:hypothetical protein